MNIKEDAIHNLLLSIWIEGLDRLEHEPTGNMKKAYAYLEKYVNEQAIRDPKSKDLLLHAYKRVKENLERKRDEKVKNS